MDILLPPFPAPDIPSSVQRNLQEMANEIASIAGPMVRDIQEELGLDPDVSLAEFWRWLYNEDGVAYMAEKVGLPFLGQGADRLVLDLGTFVAKFEFVGADENVAEWDTWHEYLKPEHRVWFARPYALSEDATVIVMEKLIRPEIDSHFLASQISQIFIQEPWMVEAVEDSSWYNWGYRSGSETPVALDYGL